MDRQHARNAIIIGEHIVIPETHDTIALSFDQRGSARIILSTMLPAIDLHNQLVLVAREVSDEVADRNLPSKMRIRKA
jgi:hypothetical protein